MPFFRTPAPLLRLHYGWWIVASAFIVLALSNAVGFYSFSLFVNPIQAEFPWGRGEMMLAFTFWALATGLAAPVVGRLVDRFGPPWAVASGAVVVGLGLASLGFVQSLWHFYAGYILAGLGSAGIGAVPATALVSNWFVRHRGLAVGLMSAGIGVGGLVFAPALGGLLIPAFGWRASYIALGALVVAMLLPLALTVMKTRPAEMGLTPYGANGLEVAPPPRRPVLDGPDLRTVAGSPAFWLLGLSFFLGSAGMGGIVQNQAPFLQDIGVNPATAAAALGVAGLFSALGKVAFGWLCDRMDPRLAWATAVALQAGGGLMLLFSNDLGGWSVWMYAVLMGLGMGGWLPTMSIIVSSTFGLAFYGTIFGAIAFLFQAGLGLGPLFAGLTMDVTGTYSFGFTALVAGYAVSIIAVLAMWRIASPPGTPR